MIVLGGWVLRCAGLALAWACLKLYLRALALGLDPVHLLWLPAVGGVVGLFKSQRVMRPRLQENIEWLRPRGAVPAWRVFPPPLLLLIACMIALVMVLKALAHGHALALAVLGTLDFAVATALLLSVGVHGPLLARSVLQPRQP
jgi:hypothetical protein